MKYTNTSQYTVNGTTKSLVYSYENTNSDNNNYTSQSSLTSGGTINVTVTEDGDVHAEALKNSSGTQIANRTTTISEDTTSITYGDGSSLIYVYDDDGNISQIKGKESASATETVLQSYTYDAFGQLTAENDAENNRSAAFTYDLNGNILSKVETVNGTSTTHTYQYGNSQWRDLLTSYDGDAITYDAGGNPLTYRDGITFTWKHGRQLASYEDDTYRITYDYNDAGIRVKKTVTEKSTGTVTVIENYLEGANIIVQKITTTPSGGTASTEMIWYIYDGTGTVVGMQTEDGIYYYEKNLQGDITSIVNESGTEVVSYSYDAWGNVISAVDTSAVQLVEKNPFTYRGYYRDNETGFYYLQSRYYDAEVGRFLNADDIFVLNMNNGLSGNDLFTYTGNSPVMYCDPTGHWVISCGIEGGAAAILGVYAAIAVNFDGNNNIAVTFTFGLTVITNASAYVAGFFAYYPKKKNVNALTGWGVSVGASASVGIYMGIGGGLELNTSGNGISGSIGVGVSIVPLPYLQIKGGTTWMLYKWKWSSKDKGKTIIKTKKGIKVYITKNSSTATIYVPKMKKHIKIYKNKKKAKIY